MHILPLLTQNSFSHQSHLPASLPYPSSGPEMGLVLKLIGLNHPFYWRCFEDAGEIDISGAPSISIGYPFLQTKIGSFN